MIIESKQDILELRESLDIEFKTAAGRDGNGELPDDFFETYSAMANSYGGTVFLGVKEHKDKSFEITGINDVARVKKKLFDSLNNKQKVNKNILSDKHIIELTLDEIVCLQINIPRAKRQERPIYKGLNPLQGTYQRNFEGDYKCDEECVKRMLAEQIEDERDSRLLEGYGINDIDADTLQAYRQLFVINKPDHPYNALDNIEFLRSIRGWARDRYTNQEGLTLAGLLMFGKLSSILEELSNYLIDYQERPEARTENRWIDRLTIDGTWSGNLFDFYRKVIRKLYADLKVPFALDKDIRKDETPIHTALREALINTIVHADYSGRTSLLVVKRPDMFGFRNPGLMRIPIESAIHGGETDCRNRIIHQMFLLVGLGERAGSGVPKIFAGWSSSHWSKPLLHEKQLPDQTLLELRMISLFDDKVMQALIDMYGNRFEDLNEKERVILATAFIEKVINHGRVNEIIDEHSHDLTMYLKRLTSEGFLNSEGNGRGKVYFLPNTHFDDPDEFSTAISGDYSASNINERTPNINEGTPNIISSLEQLDQEQITQLKLIAQPVFSNARVKDIEIVKNTILDLCDKYTFTLPVLGVLLNRAEDSLRINYLNPMVKEEHTLRMAFPNKPNHPNQAYLKA